MTTALIFGFGAFVTLITVVAVVFVGLGEAADPQTRPEDLSSWEISRVGRDDSPSE